MIISTSLLIRSIFVCQLIDLTIIEPMINKIFIKKVYHNINDSKIKLIK